MKRVLTHLSPEATLVLQSGVACAPRGRGRSWSLDGGGEGAAHTGGRGLDCRTPAPGLQLPTRVLAHTHTYVLSHAHPPHALRGGRSIPGFQGGRTRTCRTRQPLPLAESPPRGWGHCPSADRSSRPGWPLPPAAGLLALGSTRGPGAPVPAGCSLSTHPKRSFGLEGAWGRPGWSYVWRGMSVREGPARQARLWTQASALAQV